MNSVDSVGKQITKIQVNGAPATIYLSKGQDSDPTQFSHDMMVKVEANSFYKIANWNPITADGFSFIVSVDAVDNTDGRLIEFEVETSVAAHGNERKQKRKEIWHER